MGVAVSVCLIRKPAGAGFFVSGGGESVLVPILYRGILRLLVG
jgi:hypothetical protein